MGERREPLQAYISPQWGTRERDPLYVDCDDPACRALREPGDDINEVKRALEHWKSHELAFGCAHGC